MLGHVSQALLSLIDRFNRRVIFPWREKRVVNELAPFLKAGSRLLDFGCGDGHLSRALAQRTGVNVTGIDIYLPEERLIPRIVYDGEHLPFKDGSFDGAVMVDMLHHTRDVKQALRELTMVTRRFLLIKDMKYRTRTGYRVLQFTDLWTNKPDPKALLRYNYLTWEEWQEIFSELDLTVVRYQPSFSLVPLDPIRHLNFIALLEKRGAAFTGDESGHGLRGHEVVGCSSHRTELRVSSSKRVALWRTPDPPTEKAVLEANRVLFECHVVTFQELHQEVLEGEEPYLEATLEELRSRVKEGAVLDAGCGDGRLTTRVRRHFPDVTGVDLSMALLKEMPAGFKRACGDVQNLPCRDGSFSLVLCNYTLHHLYATEKFIHEAHRVLAAGGILFIDHEMDAGFMKRFRWLVRLHDLFFGLDKRYRKMDPSIEMNAVRMAEFHYFQRQGISPAELTRQLEEAGFRDIRIRHHGFGVNRFANRLFSRFKLWSTPAFLSPHFSVTARKPLRSLRP